MEDIDPKELEYIESIIPDFHELPEDIQEMLIDVIPPPVSRKREEYERRFGNTFPWLPYLGLPYAGCPDTDEEQIRLIDECLSSGKPYDSVVSRLPPGALI